MSLEFRKKFAKIFRKKKKKSATGSRAFEGEIAAVAAGTSAYQASCNEPTVHSPLLRRNTHRLEKGLCFPVVKSVFADSYIGETVAAYASALACPNHDHSELEWARDVLHRYFDSVDRTSGRVAAAHLEFLRSETEATGSVSGKTPFAYSRLSGASLVSGEEFLELCQRRVSCRWFEDRGAPREKINYAVECASQAASACNRQPFEYLLIEKLDLRKKLVSLPFGTAGFGSELPHLIMVVGDLSYLAQERDRHLIYIDSALATSQLMLAFTAQGLASVPINWPDVEENHRQARAMLQLQDHHVPIMLVGFGYPALRTMIPYSQKKTPETLLRVYE